MLVTFKQQKFNVPGEDAWMEMRPLSASERDEAADVRQRRALSMARELGADMLKALRDDKPADPNAEPVPVEDAFDRDTVLCAGIVRWSYQTPVNAKSVLSLDIATAKWAHKTIVELTIPAAGDAGNATRPSTAS